MAYLGKTTLNLLHHNASAATHRLAGILRRSETEAEKLLWQELKNRKCEGLKFRRQHPFGRFVLDFYCHEKALAVEVDGGIHKKPDAKENDTRRTKELEDMGLRVIRFTNEEVMGEMVEVLRKIAYFAGG
mgnify:CR=1 FL=1